MNSDETLNGKLFRHYSPVSTNEKLLNFHTQQNISQFFFMIGNEGKRHKIYNKNINVDAL
jgi:hypothetical protein